MNSSALSACYALVDLPVPKFVAVESAALVILAAALLVFRTFRERYLLIWILGWLAYFVSSWTIHHPGIDLTSRYAVAVSQSQFVLALCLFSAAVFVYCMPGKCWCRCWRFRSWSSPMRRCESCGGRIRSFCVWCWKFPIGSSP